MLSEVTKLETPGWPCVAAQGGWRGDVTRETNGCEVIAEFSLDGGPPRRAVFRRRSPSERHWEWEAGADEHIPRDVLDGAALRISVHMAQESFGDPVGEFG